MSARARAKRDALHARHAAPRIVRDVLRSPGEELDPKARGWMEPRFGHDFGHVRVHRDDRAAEAAEAIDAEAFAAGRHIVFGAGRYTTPVLAHELAHVTPHEHDADALSVGAAHDAEEVRAERTMARLGTAAAAGDAPPAESVIRRLSRGETIGVAAGVGALVGGIIGGLGFGGVGALVGGLIGAAVGAGIAALATIPQRPRRRRGPVGRHLEVALDINFVPTGNTPATIAQLPHDTRVVREPPPPNSQPPSSDSVHVRVTTGPLVGATGWVDGRVLVERTNTEFLSSDDAARLWQELSQSTFLTASGERLPIPFHYPVDGCFARARRMDDILQEAGYEAEKVFVVARRDTPAGPGRLRVETPFGEETSGQRPAVTWWYHVAPVVRVQAADGTIQEIVLDPSITDGPVPVDQWISRQGRPASDYREVSLEEFREGVAEAGGVGQYEDNVFFIAPRGTYQPLQDQPSTPGEPAETMTTYAREAQTRELVSALRTLAGNPSSTLAQVLSTIQAATPYARHDLVQSVGPESGGEGRQTLAALRAKFGDAGYQQIDAALRAP